MVVLSGEEYAGERGVSRQEVRAPEFVVPANAREQWLALRAALDLVTWPVPCTVEPERWFGWRASPAVAEAVVGCGTCPVVHLCAAYGIAAREVGVWGGLTDEDRAVLRRGAVA